MPIMHSPPPPQQPAIVQYTEPPKSALDAAREQNPDYNIHLPGEINQSVIDIGDGIAEAERRKEEAEEIQRQQDAQRESEQGSSKDIEPKQKLDNNSANEENHAISEPETAQAQEVPQEQGASNTPETSPEQDYYSGIGY